MADRSIVEILLRARGGRQVASETRAASGAINRMERSTVAATRAGAKFSGTMRSVGRGALYAGGALATGLVIEVKRGTEAWEEHRKIAADTARAIKTTGGVANVSAKHVDRLANSIQAKTAVDDDQVAAGQNMLLTFLRVRNEAGKGNKVFDRATGLAVDMAARFGGDTKRSFIQLGKALDDPIKGITALRRVGVSFTAAETEKIKTLEETGHHLEAQRLILAALDKQVGGSARAQATPIKHLKESWGDLEKQLGGALAPTIDKVAGKLDDLTKDASRIFARKDLTLEAKFKRFGKQDLEPLAKDLVQGLKDAHVDDKLEGAVEWAIPKIADGFATAAPHAAKAFLHGFQGAGTWGKLLTAGFLMKKLGGFGALGRLMAGSLGGGKAGLVSKAQPIPVFVVNNGPGGAPGGGGWKGWAGRGAAASRLATLGSALPAVGLVGLGGAAYMAGGKTSFQRKKRIGESAETAMKSPLGMPPAVGRDRSGNVYSVRVPGTNSTVAVDPRLAGYPDSHMTSSASRLTGYPDSHLAAIPRATGNAVKSAMGAIAHRPLNVRTAVRLVMPDGRVLADIVAEHPGAIANAVSGERLHYKDRG